MASPPRILDRAVRRPVDTATGSILGVLATLLGLLVLGYVVLYVTKGRFLKSTFESHASKFADRGVRVGGDFQFYFNPHLKFLAENLQVDNPAWAKDRQLFTARLIDSETAVLPLLHGERRVRFLTLDGASVGAEIDKVGHNTWTFAGDEPFQMPAIDRASITGSTLHYLDARQNADVRVRFGDVSAANAQDKGTVKVAGPLNFVGEGTARGEPFTLRGSLTTPNETAAGGRVGFDLHANALRAKIDASGTLAGVTRLDGADLKVDASGANIQTIAAFFGKSVPATPFEIKASVTPVDRARPSGQSRLSVTADAAQTHVVASGVIPRSNSIEGADIALDVSGRNLQTAFKLFGLVSPASRPYRLTSQLTKSGDTFRFRKMTGRIGGSDIEGTLTADVSNPKPLLTGDLRTRVLDIKDVGPLLGYSPAAVDAPGGPKLVREVGGTPRIIPDATLAIEQLKAFNAEIKYAAEKIDTGSVKLSGLVVDLSLKDSRLRLKPVAFNIIGGRMTAEIDLDARVRPVVTSYDIKMSRVPLGQMLTQFDVEKSGTTASVFGRVQLKGYGDTMRESLATSNGRIALVFPAGTLWMRNIQLGKLDLQNYITSGLLAKLKRPQEIRCGVIAFTVKDGISAADPILFDTRRANFRGLGEFSFRDESLALRVRGDSKEFSLFSGQSPVGIGGYFSEPSIRPISPQLIARTAAGVGLGVATGGLGAILAFVDIGDAKNVNCAAVQAAKTAKEVAAAPSDPKRK